MHCLKNPNWPKWWYCTFFVTDCQGWTIEPRQWRQNDRSGKGIHVHLFINVTTIKIHSRLHETTTQVIYILDKWLLCTSISPIRIWKTLAEIIRMNEKIEMQLGVPTSLCSMRWIIEGLLVFFVIIKKLLITAGEIYTSGI